MDNFLDKITTKMIDRNWSGCSVYLNIPLYRKDLEESNEHRVCRITEDNEEYELNLIEHKMGVFTFYAKQLKDNKDHKAGYLWSSRCSVMNKFFGTELVEVGAYLINSQTTPYEVGIKVSDLKDVLPEEYCIVKRTDRDGEINYKVIDRRFIESLNQEGYREA